ncbi:MAG: cell division protein ZapB [Bacteroidales bacterium]|nr:cell division protein ZapB [Bacteroidales bacterium]
MLKELESSVKELIARYEAVRADNDALREKLRLSEEKNEDYRKQITELEKDIDNFKLTGAFLGTAENRDVAKRRIDKLLREIDKCITLMED